MFRVLTFVGPTVISYNQMSPLKWLSLVSLNSHLSPIPTLGSPYTMLYTCLLKGTPYSIYAPSRVWRLSPSCSHTHPILNWLRINPFPARNSGIQATGKFQAWYVKVVIVAKRDWLLLPFSFSSPPTFLINSLVGLSELLICKIWREPHAISRSIAEIEDFASFVHN